jgi:integrase
MLSQRLLELLRKYWQEARPGMGYLFPGCKEGGSANRRSASRAFRQAATAAGLGAKVTTHSLRRSFATHLIELGTDVTVVKSLLGHSSLRTTEVYAVTREALLMRTRSPLDVLGTPAGEILG